MALRPWVADGGWVLSGRVSALLCALALNASLARLLTAPRLGSYYLWASAAAAAVSFASLGLGPVALRRVSMSLGGPAGSGAAASALARAALAWGARGALAVSAVFFGAASLFTGGALVPAVVACWIAALVLSGLLADVLRGFRDLRAASLQTEVLGGWAGLAAVWLLFAFRRPLVVPEAIAGIVLGLVLAVAYGRRALARHLAPAPPDRSPFAWWWGQSRAVWMITGLSLVLGQMDLWILGAFRPRADVAVYGLASRVAMLLLQPDAMARTLLMPRAAALHARGDAPGLERLARSAATATAALAAAGAAALALVGAPGLAFFFGEPYRACLPIALILAVGFVGKAIAGPAAATLLMTGHQSRVLRTSLAGSATTLALLVALTPRGGARGAAAAVAIGYLVQNALMAALARRTLGIWTLASLRPSEWRAQWIALRAPASADNPRGPSS